MLNKIAPYYKAVAAVVTPTVGGVIVAMQSDTPGGSNITSQEWLSILLVAVAAGLAVFTVPNLPQEPPPEGP